MEGSGTPEDPFIVASVDHLQKINLDLEKIVHKRTSELEEANRQLEKHGKELEIIVKRRTRDMRKKVAKYKGGGMMETDRMTATECKEGVELWIKHICEMMDLLLVNRYSIGSSMVIMWQARVALM